MRLALDSLQADLERRLDDAASGADILLDDIPARIEAICQAGLTLAGDDRLFLANRLDIIHDILDDVASVLTTKAPS